MMPRSAQLSLHPPDDDALSTNIVRNVAHVSPTVVRGLLPNSRRCPCAIGGLLRAGSDTNKEVNHHGLLFMLGCACQCNAMARPVLMHICGCLWCVYVVCVCVCV